mmetsp:Transcript_34845/g.93078  ORF Transcript_34845/g.93078 Transcript_34845/m.93078 type:complete len:95 (+) Transcript_34845:1-285(+)
MGISMHVAEGAFWWGEAYTVALPRLKALPSALQRLRALAMAVGRPPYTTISFYLFGPPVIVLLLLLAYDEYAPVSGGDEGGGGKAKAKAKAKSS